MLNNQFQTMEDEGVTEFDNAQASYVDKSAYVWHNMMGGGAIDAFKKMIGGGLTQHYIDNDEGFTKFVNAKTPEGKAEIVRVYRTDDKGWEYADTDEQIIERLKTHGVSTLPTIQQDAPEYNENVRR